AGLQIFDSVRRNRPKSLREGTGVRRSTMNPDNPAAGGRKRMATTRGVTRRTILTGTAGLLAAPALIGRAHAATRGVTDTQITFGTMQDLSGVTAVQGVNNANAMRMVYDAVNAKGGIHGRKLNWVLEDMQYIVPKAVQAMNKMLNRDDVFFCIG